MQFTSVYSRRWSPVWAGAVPHDRASFWVVQSCVSSLQQCAPVKNPAFPKVFGKPEGGKCRYGGRACSLSPLCQACPDPLGTSLGSTSRAQHQSLPKGHRLVSLAQPCEGTASGCHLPCEIIWVLSTLGLGLMEFSVIFILHQMLQGGHEAQVISTKAWSWPGCEWDKAGAWVAQASAEAFATNGIWVSCGYSEVLWIVIVIVAPLPPIKWISGKEVFFWPRAS